MFFEGPEKKLELEVKAGTIDFLSFDKQYWEKVVAASNATILSEIRNEKCIAYLLSESSLFVWKNRLTMITCGRTQLVAAIELLLETIPEADITFLTYERKNEHFPRSQPTHFYDDARRLNKIIPGRAYIFGDQDMHHIFLYHLDKPYHAEAGDMTLELLLHGIDEEAAKLFCSGEQRSLEHIHQQTGICQIIDGFTVDDFLFEPDGYSLNAINDQEYYTIHVTPQDTGSYVSFETNHGQFENYSAIIERVLNIFRPNSWDFVLFKSEWARIGIESEYFRKREVEQRLSCGFDVRFASFILPQKQVLSAKEIDIYEGEL